MGRKRLTINLFSNIISYATTILISFFLTPYLVNTLGKEIYGFYPLANNFVSYMSIFTTALNSMASRFITIEIVKNNYSKANTYFSSIFFSNVILSIIFLIPMTLIVIFIDKILDIPLGMENTIRLLFIFVFISMIINIITSVFSVCTFAKNRIDLRSGAELIQGILRIILFITLFAIFKPSIVYVGLVALILSIVNLVIQSIYKKMLLPKLNISKNFYDIKAVLEILSSGIWNSINSLGSILLSGLSLLISNIFLGASASGIYAIVQTLPNFINGVQSMLVGVFVPEVTYKYAQNDIDGVIREIKTSQKIVGLFLNVPIMLLIIFGNEFFKLWVPNEDVKMLQILSIILLIPILMASVTAPIFNLNMIINAVKIPSLVVLGTGAINVLLTFILLKTTDLGLIAIPLTTSILNFIRTLVFVPIYPCIKLKIKITTFFPDVLRTLVTAIIIGGMFYVGRGFVNVDSWISLIIVFIVFGIIGVIINLFISFNTKEIMSLGEEVIVKLKNRKNEK